MDTQVIVSLIIALCLTCFVVFRDTHAKDKNDIKDEDKDSVADAGSEMTKRKKTPLFYVFVFLVSSVISYIILICFQAQNEFTQSQYHRIKTGEPDF